MFVCEREREWKTERMLVATLKEEEEIEEENEEEEDREISSGSLPSEVKWWILNLGAFVRCLKQKNMEQVGVGLEPTTT